MVLENGVFYQTSYDGTKVAIIADYPGLLPASHVSNQETLCPRGFFSFFLTHRTILCSEGEAFGASGRHRGVSGERGSRAGQAFEE